MLVHSNTLSYQSYGFRFQGNQQQDVAGLHSLGFEREINPATYHWDGMKRSEFGKIIFQYTLKGKGQININDEIFDLKPGNAFLVNIPSKHRYYLPKDSDEWEFIFLTFYGREAEKWFERITEKFGQVLDLDSDSPPINLIFHLLHKAANNDLQDAFESSAYAYSFLMNIMSHMQNSRNQQWPSSVLKAVQFIKKNYTEPISLDEIVQITSMSKYHFTRVFKEYTQMTPMKFVAKTRIEEALKLLKDNNLTIDEIAKKVGYANGNYFNKVFRSFVGVSPGKYRSGKTFLPFDQIIID